MTKPVKLKSIAVDIKKERSGDWVSSTAYEGVSYLVKSTATPEYQSARTKMLRQFAKSNSGPDVDIDKIHEARAKLTCQHLLLDWKNLDEPYTPELAIEVLTDPAYRNLLEDIEACANRVGQSDIEFMETEAKN